MSKSKDNNVDNAFRQISEGQLLKYTNMVKGWQNRWFVLNPNSGMLEYYMSESEKKMRPRSSLHLAGAMIVPSEEDSYTFSVNAANEESFKLRALDAKERQYWVNQIRIIAQAYTQVLAESNPPLNRDHSQMSNALSTASISSDSPFNPIPTQKILTCNLTVLDAFGSVRDYLRRVECEHQRLIHDVEYLPTSGPNTTCTNTDMLLLKATSQATILCLEQCLAILHFQQQQPNKVQLKINSAGSSPVIGPMKKNPRIVTELPRVRSESAVSTLGDKTMSGLATGDNATVDVDNEDDYVDDEDIGESKLSNAVETASEEYKNCSMKLLSQLKRGTELTRTNLPVLLCEQRSLLQVIADAFRQPHLLLRLAEESSPEVRMSRVVHWYLSSFRACQLEMNAARKPFNPVLGETFSCLWKVTNEKSGEESTLRFRAEQVSHDPPISAFHLESPQKVNVLGSMCVKASFMGMYAVATLNGDLSIQLEQLNNEKYEMGYPILYLRSVITEPWLEFGGKVQINCPDSKVSASLMFQVKPFYGGQPHQVTAEIKNASETTVCKMSGDWNNDLQLSWTDGLTETLPLRADWLGKKVRPLHLQKKNESHQVWLPVRRALAQRDFLAASEKKKIIEEMQREKERNGVETKPVHFEKDNETWIRKSCTK